MTTVEELRDKQIEFLDRRISEIHQDLKGDIRELRQVLFVVMAAALVSVVGIFFQTFSK